MRRHIRQAIRSFSQSPWFTLVALLTLALGIGVNSALFSVVKAVLVENLPYGKPDQLIRVWVTNPTQGFDRDVTSYPRFEDWKTRSRTIAEFAGFTAARLILTGADEPVQLRGALITANFFRVMGVRPILGHDFSPSDDQEGQAKVVMLSYGLWNRAFAADTSILGRRVRLSGNEYTVSGVLPETFAFPERGLDFWTPLVLDRDRRQARGNFFMNVVARLKDGVGLAQAQLEMDSIAHALQSEYVIDRNLGVVLVGLKEDLTGTIRPALMVLAGAVTFILLICCANIAGMLSSRGIEREREISIRMALGAGRKQVLAQLLTESVMLFFCGGLLGVFVAYAGIRLLLRFSPPELQQLQDAHLDLIMIALTFAVSATCGFIFGLKPAFHAARGSTMESLKTGGRGIAGRLESRRFRTVLTVGEIALAMVLTTGAVLMVRSFTRMQQADLGFDAQRVSVAPLQLPAAKYREGRQVSDFFDALMAKLHSTPGIQSAGLISTFLLGRLPDSDMFTIEGRAQTIFTPLTIDVVSPDIFAAMKIPLVRGRLFDTRDRADSPPVVIINEATATRYWPNADPIGQRFTYGSSGPKATWYTIIGVVANTRRAGVDRPIFTESYIPMSQQPERMLQVLVRSTLSTDATRQALTTAVHELDAEQPLASFETIESAMGKRTAAPRFVVFLLSLFAGTAVCIGGVGIYGLISFLVTQRRQEFGVRIALGARPSDVARLILRDVGILTSIGLIIGGISASLFSRLLATMLFGVGHLDPTSYGAAAIGMTFTCLIAAMVPLIRAMRVDPMIALRHQ